MFFVPNFLLDFFSFALANLTKTLADFYTNSLSGTAGIVPIELTAVLALESFFKNDSRRDRTAGTAALRTNYNFG